MVDEIMTRQETESDLLKFESFKVETASRRVMGEMLSFYSVRDENNNKQIKEIKDITEKQQTKIAQMEKQMKKVLEGQQDQEKIRSSISKMKMKVDNQQETLEKQINQVKDMHSLYRGQTESKLEILTLHDQRFAKLEREMQKLRELIHQQRDRQQAEINEEGMRTTRLQQHVHDEIDKLTKRVDQTRYFQTKTSESIQLLDTQVASFKSQLQSSFEKLESENERRLLTEEFKRAFKQMNEFLIIKFREQDDIKNSVRDSFTFLKLYSPLQTQLQLNDTVSTLIKQTNAPLFQEEKCLLFQQLRMESLLQTVLMEKARADKQIQDNERKGVVLSGSIINEMLIRHALPREEQQRNKAIGQSCEEFVIELIRQHIQDAKQRANKQKLFSGNYQNTTENLRMNVGLQSIYEIIENVENKIEQQLKKSKKQTEEAIAQRKQLEQEKRNKRLLQKKLEMVVGTNPSNQNRYKIPLRKTNSMTTLPKTTFFDLKEVRNIKRTTLIKMGKKSLMEGLKKGQDNQLKEGQNEEVKLDFNSIAPFMDIHYRTADIDLPEFFKQSQAQINQQQSKIINQESKNQIVKEESKLSKREEIVVITPPIQDKIFVQDEGIRSPLDYQQQQIQYMPQQNVISNGKLSKAQRKKLVQELKEDIQAVMANAIELKVSEQTSSLQSQIRKIELDIASQQHRVAERFSRDLDDCRKGFQQDFVDANQELLDDIAYLKKQRIRDKSDFDLSFNEMRDKQKDIKKHLNHHNTYFEAVAQIISMLVESTNMALYSEEQDIRDRSKMSLVGAKDTKLIKQDLHASKIDRHNISTLDQSIQNEYESKSTALPNMTARSQSIHATQLEISKLHHQQHNPLIVKTSHPINLDQSCLSCQVSGHDTQHILYMFKLACLTYQPSPINYRSKSIQRQDMIRLRKQMLDKSMTLIQKTQLFKQNALYPKRYFDDLVIEDSLMQGSLIEQADKYQKKISFGIGNKSEYKEATKTLNNTQSTFNQYDTVLETKYQQEGQSRNKAAKAVQNLTLTNGKDSKRLGDRNHSMHIDLKQKSISTTRNFNNTAIDYKTQGTQNMQSNRQSVFSGDSSRKPNFDIEEIIKNPNAQIKKHSNAFHNRTKNQSVNQQMLATGIVYPSLAQQLELTQFSTLNRPKVSTTLGFQDLPRINRQ